MVESRRITRVCRAFFEHPPTGKAISLGSSVGAKVSIVILLVLVAVLWVVVLAPSVWRRFSERHGAGSIDHFHHQLELLEHAGPKLVTPAYRLRGMRAGIDGSGAALATAPTSSRP